MSVEADIKAVPQYNTVWEYATLVLTGGFLGRHKEELRRKDFEKQLADWGSKGWELAWVLMEQRLHGEKDGHVAIFKRPKPREGLQEISLDAMQEYTATAAAIPVEDRRESMSFAEHVAMLPDGEGRSHDR